MQERVNIPIQLAHKVEYFVQGLMGRYYEGRPIMCEFSPVTDFREATCRQYEENTCTRGGYCNFMHLRPISRYCLIDLFQPFS